MKNIDLFVPVQSKPGSRRLLVVIGTTDGAGNYMLFSPLGPGGPAELFVLVLAHFFLTPFNNATHELTSSLTQI
jgi:hypothetical protein